MAIISLSQPAQPGRLPKLATVQFRPIYDNVIDLDFTQKYYEMLYISNTILLILDIAS